MANPLLITITPANAWQKVATNATKGQIIIKDRSGPNAYYYTYVETGDAAPTGIPIGNIFDDVLEIDNSIGIDVYVYAVGAVGKVEAQL